MSYISMDKKLLDVPTSLADITLEQYLKFMKLPDELSEDDRISEMINIFTGMSRALIRKMTKKSRYHVVQLLKNCINTRTQPLVMTCELQGMRLGFVPNLDKMAFGEFVDLETTKYEAENYEQIMKVLYRPIRKQDSERYDILPYDQCMNLALDYSKMTMDCVLGAMLFFCDLGKDLLSHMMKSLQEDKQKISQQEQTSQVSGGGTAVLLASLNMTLEGLIKLRESHFISV